MTADTGKIRRAIPINLARKGVKRMRPIIDALLDENVSISQLSEEIGISRQSINRWFNVDDAKLSQVEELGRAMGYEVELKLTKKD